MNKNVSISSQIQYKYKEEGQKKINHVNSNEKKAEINILISKQASE